MRTRQRTALALIGLAAAFLGGCNRHSKKETFYLISANTSLPYWQTAAAGFKHAAEQFMVTAKVDGPEGHDAQAELAVLQKAVAAKPAGILISVADATVLKPGIDAAMAAGVPVITLDSDAAASRRLYFIGTNNLEAGRLAGRRISLRLSRGNIVVFTLAGQPNTEERLEGVKDSLSSKPDLKIVDVVDIKSDPRVAFDTAQQLLSETGPKKVDAFICLDSASGKMVADALRRSNTTDRVLVAWDVNPDTLEGIKSGAIDAAIAQKPYTMGYVGLKMLDEIFHAPPKSLSEDYSADSFALYPAFIDTGTSVVDKSNVDMYLSAAASHK